MAGEYKNITVDTTAANVATPISTAPASDIVREVTLQYKPTNAGIVQIGGAGVSASGTNGGVRLSSPDDFVVLEDADLTKLYISTSISGEGVTGFSVD